MVQFFFMNVLISFLVNLSSSKLLIGCSWMTFGGVGVRRRGGVLYVGVPSMHSMSNLSMARHVHGIVEHV